ncbi:M20/M25/M40 family metallo-hydrolase [Paraburkholderia sp.]|uniref:M20/M25/M40 family metallo-hydrolase n=1 Tax=Paraburkholderia sp. TaxID=1926495 RepID=UPI0039E28714
MQMSDYDLTLDLLKRMISIDSRSFVSNLPIADLIESELHDWDLEIIDYIDDRGTAKRNIVARYPGSNSKLAFAGHLDTVPDTGWVRRPFESVIEGDNLYGLGASDMKGPIAAFIIAAKSLHPEDRPTLVFTADEEAGKQGVREVVARSQILNVKHTPQCFIVAEPTSLNLVRGHRVDIQFVAHAKGVQAHSSTGKGKNANLALIPFLNDLSSLHRRLRDDVQLQDNQYDPPFCDLNFVIDNYGAFPNTTVGLATCTAKFRYSKSFDPGFVVEEIKKSSIAHGIDLHVKMEAPPPELEEDHYLVTAAKRILGCCAKVSGLGTEASEYSKLAPSLIYGPGDIECAHKPTEYIALAQLYRSVDAFKSIATSLI